MFYYELSAIRDFWWKNGDHHPTRGVIVPYAASFCSLPRKITKILLQNFSSCQCGDEIGGGGGGRVLGLVSPNY